MAHPVLSDDEARTLFTTLRDTTFDWTADHLPALMAELGWTIDESVTIQGKAALADVSWSLPQAVVKIQLSGNTVNAFYIPLASPANDSSGRLEVADAFARYAALLQDIMDTPGMRVPGDHPGLRWRYRNAVLKLQSGAKSLFAFWASAQFQETLDIVAAQ